MSSVARTASSAVAGSALARSGAAESMGEAHAVVGRTYSERRMVVSAVPDSVGSDRRTAETIAQCRPPIVAAGKSALSHRCRL